ncbi:MAG: cytochrome d ubiquinol oxidase subunit II [Myxococcales bacterium]
MTGLWYALVALMFVVYAVLDGFDFGAGTLHLFVARTDRERREVLAAIGPVWNGNEVWLIAGGATLFFAFPQAYAAGFSGFYLPLMLVLWLLALRGISIELRSHVEDVLWRQFWDAVLCGSSAAMSLVLGAALGNVLRGVPLDSSGTFMAPWFTNFRVRGQAGVLDWYTILLGVFAVVALSLHGALFLVWRNEAAVRERALQAARLLWPAMAVLGALAIVATALVRPEIYPQLMARPWAWPLALLALAGLIGARTLRDLPAFIASSAFLAGTLAATAAGMFPVLLPSTLDPAFAITAAGAAAGEHSQRVALGWWGIGIPLALAYTTYIYRNLRGKAVASEH